MALARRRAEVYLKLPGTSLETARPFVENAMLLDQIFRGILAEQKCRAITINQCMSTIMPLAETTACLPLSTLNDDGFLAFCESDFVVIPAGMLMASISGRIHRRDRRPPVPADLSFADRCQIHLRQPEAGRAHARL